MMTKNIQISIPNPCHENWDKMLPAERGKFCNACQKPVLDFTTATDREIAKAFEKDQNLCGHFQITQLDRNLEIPKARKSLWLASVFFGVLTLFDTKVQAQGKPKIVQTDQKLVTDTTSPLINDNWIEGVVCDEVGLIPGATIFIKGTSISTTSGFDGKYKIKAKNGDVLVFSFIGLKNVEKTIGQSHNVDVFFKESVKLTGEVVFCRKKNFFGRCVNKIKNWFR